MSSDEINAPSGEAERRMVEAIETLRELRSYAGAVATLDRSDDAELLVLALGVTMKLAERIRRDRMRDRLASHRRAVAARNDELGIPNCEHLVRDPDCAECSKIRPTDRSLYEG